MSDKKIWVKPPQVVVKNGQHVTYIDDGGTLRKAKVSSVIISETPPLVEGTPLAETPAESANVVDESSSSAPLAGDSSAPGEPEAGSDRTQEGKEVTGNAGTQSPPASNSAPPSSNTSSVKRPSQDAKSPVKAGKTSTSKEPRKTMATAAAKKPPAKTAAKKAPAKTAKAKTESSGVRTIAGKVVDINKYTKTKAPGGGISYNNGDAVAEKLEGKTLDEAYALTARTLKTEEKELRKQYSHLNVGMQRMTLGNRLRKVLIPKAAK